MLHLGDPAIYLDFFARSLDFALWPHLSRHPLAAAKRINGEKQACEWIPGQVREGVSNPEWYRKDVVGEIGIICAQSFRRIRNCRLPLHVVPRMSYELHKLRRMDSERRSQMNGWPMDSPHMGRRAFREVVARYNDRARRWL